jgi:hypothetical protein
VALLFRFTFLALLFFSVGTVSDAAMIYDIKLYNASGRSVEIVDKDTGRSWATIPPGRSKSFTYYGGVSLRCDGRQLTYTRVDPPTYYFSPGLFSTSFKAQLGSDLRIYLLPPSATLPATHLPSQPKGFPLRAATHRPNQALERTATRFAFASCVVKTFSLRATLAPGGRRSALSR